VNWNKSSVFPDARFFQIVGILSQNYTASQPRRLWLETSFPCFFTYITICTV